MAKFILSSFADEAADGLDEQLRISEKNGLRFIEMRNVNGKSLVDCSPAEVRTIRAALRAHGFRLSAVGSPFGKIKITDDFGPHLERFRRCAGIAAELEARYIRMFSFYIPEGGEPAVYRDEVMERLQKFTEVLEGSGIVCCHENEKSIFGNSPERCLDILKTFAGKIRGIFDPANFIQESFQPLPAFEMLEPHIEYMHVKDALLSDGSVTPAGKGDGSIAELLRRFSQKEGERFLTVEPHLAVFKGFSELENGAVSIKKHGYAYASNEEAYDTAVGALKGILSDIGCPV